MELNFSKIVDGLAQVIRDSFITADSWYLVYSGMPFFELGLVPIAFLGWMRLKSELRPAWLIGLVITLPMLILSVPFTGAYPGMRRALFVLLPYYTLVGLGCSCFFEWATKTSMFRLCNFLKPLSITLILSVAAHNILYQMTLGRSLTSHNFGTGFVFNTIPLDFLHKNLLTHNVLLRESEFSGGQFDLLIYTNYPRMVAKYNVDKPIGTVKILKNFDEVFQKLENSRPSIYMTWSSADIAELTKLQLICIPESNFSSQSYQETDIPYWGYLIQPEYPNKSCISIANENDRAGEKINFYAGKIERLRHMLSCEGDGCGSDRKDFIYTRGGVVSFLLSKPTGSVKQNLQISVINPDPIRKSIVEVNGVEVGVLSTDNLQNNVVSFSIPASAKNNKENWVINILPSKNPEHLGWDIVSAELVAQ